jgi:hypothetical protein
MKEEGDGYDDKTPVVHMHLAWSTLYRIWILERLYNSTGVCVWGCDYE